MLKSVLIANRGEIALRIARTCRDLGLEVIAVHSSEDDDSPVVRLADRSVRIGPAPPRRSYLNMPAVVEAAMRSGADAIHPGYGFLSEDADFADVCADNGITLIGPSASVLAVLGDKTSARAAMARAGLPLLPGGIEPLADADAAQAWADEIGYPVIIKAAAGGGGRGMRAVHERRDLVPAFEAVRATALALFGSDAVYVERYLTAARHVEVQILGDGRGGVVHLGERDCTVQRRHQKLVEETPAPRLPEATRGAMCAAAVRGAAALRYRGAGTFEFLLEDAERFWFMEVNPRLQVEHPVTEMVTGIDVVREQIRVATGLGLSVTQADVEPRGVAVECRVNAEDPDRDFVPTPGHLEALELPGGPFVRLDTFVGPGDRISPAYDSLIAKIVTWGPDRDQALARMRRALAEVRVRSRTVRTTTGFLRRVLDTQEFIDATHTTGLVERMTAVPAADLA